LTREADTAQARHAYTLAREQASATLWSTQASQNATHALQQQQHLENGDVWYEESEGYGCWYNQDYYWVHNANDFLICASLAASYEKNLAKGMDEAKARARAFDSLKHLRDQNKIKPDAYEKHVADLNKMFNGIDAKSAKKGVADAAATPISKSSVDLVISKSSHTLDLTETGWRSVKFQQEGIVYVVRDGSTGELLKVGQTTSTKFVGRFEKYVTAGNKTGKNITIDAFDMPLDQRGIVEGQIRRHLSSQSDMLPWDNTGRRLGRSGSGIPDSPSTTIWNAE